LNRTIAVQVSQAKHLFDHVKLVERHIDEVDSEKQQYAAEVQRLREVILSLEKRALSTNEHVERLKHEAKKHESDQRDLDAARFGMHYLETKITLLSNENRLLTQKVGLQGLGDATLSKRLAEKSKEFDDLAAELRETKASQRGVESRIHGEVSEMQQEMLRLRIHAEQTQSEVIRLNMVVQECDSVIAKQQRVIGDLEASKADGGRLSDDNYILRTESD
jgi:peptidoglycan hydrolase CwlO-like protein